MRRFQFLDPPQGPQKILLPQTAPMAPWKLFLVLVGTLSLAVMAGTACWHAAVYGGTEGGPAGHGLFIGIAMSLGMLSLTGLAAPALRPDSVRFRIAVLLVLGVVLVVYGPTSLIVFVLVTSWTSWWAAVIPAGVLTLALYVVAVALHGAYGHRAGTHDRQGFPIDRPGYRRPVPLVVSARQLPVPVHPLMRKYAALPAAIAVVYYVLLWAFTPAEGPDLLFGPIVLLILSAGSALTNVGYGGMPEMMRDFRFESGRVALVMGTPVFGGLMAFAVFTESSGWSKAIAVVPPIWAVTVLVLHGIGARTRDRAYIQVRRDFEAGKSARRGATLNRAPRPRN